MSEPIYVTIAVKQLGWFLGSDFADQKYAELLRKTPGHIKNRENLVLMSESELLKLVAMSKRTEQPCARCAGEPSITVGTTKIAPKSEKSDPVAEIQSKS